MRTKAKRKKQISPALKSMINEARKIIEKQDEAEKNNTDTQEAEALEFVRYFVESFKEVSDLK